MNLRLNCNKADDWKTLAKKCHVPEETLLATVDRYNADCDSGSDRQFKKSPKFFFAMRKPPFYAIRFSAAKTLWATPFLTLGGLVVDFDSGLLLDAQKRP